jgi:hypothetical protein
MWVSNMRMQYGARVKKFAYITDGIRVFKDCIPWDFPSSSITLLKRTLATYIINSRPYVHMDNGYGSKYYFFDVVDTSGNVITSTARDSWIDSMVSHYRDGSKPMNEIAEPLTFKDVPIIIKKSGYKSWVMIRSTNNNFIFAPSASVDGVDWDYSKMATINGDTGVFFSPSFSENGTLLSNKYMLKTSPTITDTLTMADGSSTIIKKSGYKSWVCIRSGNNNFILAPSTAADGTTWDFTKQFTINGDTGNVSVISLNENGTPLANKYAPIMVSVPATATSTGTAGQTAMDANYFYVCVATNTWKRTPLSTW